MEIENVSANSESLFMENELLKIESVRIDPEDYDGASFDDAYHDLQHPETVEWPNDAYREFMEIINKHQLSNSAGDAIINFFNKHSNLDISLLPSATKIGKEFLDNSTVTYLEFKEVPIITTIEDFKYTFYYRSLIKAIKSLLMIDSINKTLVLNFEDKKEMKNNVESRIFEEQYNSN